MYGLLVFETGFPYSPRWTQTHYLAQAELELMLGSLCHHIQFLSCAGLIMSWLSSVTCKTVAFNLSDAAPLDYAVSCCADPSLQLFHCYFMTVTLLLLRVVLHISDTHFPKGSQPTS